MTMAMMQKTIRYGWADQMGRFSPNTYFNYVAGTMTYTDRTSQAGSTATSDTTITGALGDIAYVGCVRPIGFLQFVLAGSHVGGTREWEYSQGGGSWGALSPTFLSGNKNFTSLGLIAYMDPPDDWVTDTVNGVTLYWLRFRVTSAYSSSPAGNYVFVGDAHRFDKLVVIPETSGRVFRSVFLKLYMAGTENTSFSVVRIRAALGLSGWVQILDKTDQSSLMAFSQSHAFGTTMLFDLTSLFENWFAGSSEDLDIEVAGNGGAILASTRNIRTFNAELFVTYDYDIDDNDQQINTVVIPIESLTGELTASHQQFGGSDAIPILTGSDPGRFLRESGISIVEMYLSFACNSKGVGTNDYALCFQLDSAPETQPTTYRGSSSAEFLIETVLWKNTVEMDPTVAHTISARVTDYNAARPVGMGGYLVVTYTYDYSDTTEETTSLQFPIDVRGDIVSGVEIPTVYEVHETLRKLSFYIPDPSPTLLTSGAQVHLSCFTAGSDSYMLSFGGQAFRLYTLNPGVSGTPLGTGFWPYMQRFDAGGVEGLGVTFGAGRVDLSIKTKVFTANPNNYGGEYAVVMLNYRAAKRSGKRNATVFRLVHAQKYASGPLLPPTMSMYTLAFAEPSGLSVPFVGAILTQAGDYAACEMSMIIHKGDNLGYFSSKRGYHAGDATKYVHKRVHLELPCFRRCSGDAADRIDPATSRMAYLPVHITRNSSLLVHQEFNEQFTISGNISGSAGGTVEICLFTDEKELVGRTTRVDDGSFSFSWVDRARNVFVTAYESVTKKGMSKAAPPGTGFDVNLSGGGGSPAEFSCGHVGVM